MAFRVAVGMEGLVAKNKAAMGPTVAGCMAMVVVMEGTHLAFKIRIAEGIVSKSMMNTTRVR